MIQKLKSSFKLLFTGSKGYRRNISSFEKEIEAIKSEENVDMTNVISSIFFSESLYKQLKVLCHPDRFVHDKELVIISTDIFQRLSVNKRNLKMLIKIKAEAVEKLKIKM